MLLLRDIWTPHDGASASCLPYVRRSACGHQSPTILKRYECCQTHNAFNTTDPFLTYSTVQARQGKGRIQVLQRLLLQYIWILSLFFPRDCCVLINDGTVWKGGEWDMIPGWDSNLDPRWLWSYIPVCGRALVCWLTHSTPAVYISLIGQIVLPLHSETVLVGII